MEKTGRIMAGGLGVLIGLVMLAGVAQAYAPQYACPICGVRFATYDELYAHFTSGHPSDPIEVIWS